MQPDEIERDCRSARRSARTIRAMDSAYGGRAEIARPHHAPDLERKEEDHCRTAGHGQQWGVRDAVYADARMLTGRRRLFRTGRGMAHLVQQRGRLRKEERNRRQADEPISPNRLQGAALHGRAQILAERPAACLRPADAAHLSAARRAAAAHNALARPLRRGDIAAACPPDAYPLEASSHSHCRCSPPLCLGRFLPALSPSRPRRRASRKSSSAPPNRATSRPRRATASAASGHRC